MADPAGEHASRVATHLLNIGAVTLSPDHPYTWASGLKSPVYCDNRLTLAFPDVRKAITSAFVDLLEGGTIRPDVIAGTATAGIPHAAWLADRLDLPMAYVRSKPKDHGRANLIEGQILPGQHVVVVEDLISTGGSSVAVVEAVRQAGGYVDALLAIFSYGLDRAQETFDRAGVPVYTVTTFAEVMAAARREKLLEEQHLTILEAWRRDPQRWSEEWLRHHKGQD